MAYIDPTTRTLTLAASGDLARSTSATAERAYTRLFTERGSCFWDTTFGSRLHLLRRAKITGSFERQLEDAVREAWRPLLDAGELVGLQFAHERVDHGRWHTVVHVEDAARAPIAFDIWTAVA